MFDKVQSRHVDNVLTDDEIYVIKLLLCAAEVLNKFWILKMKVHP